MGERSFTDDLHALLEVLPPTIRQWLEEQPDLDSLLEVVLDLGRMPEARFMKRTIRLEGTQVEEYDLKYVEERIGEFGKDNRAGIPRTLHRISAIRNRQGRIIGLTCRVGRAIFGTIDIIHDIVASGKSILMLGKPGVGKTTRLREVARVLADEYDKRVVIVDTSNEIAGDGDIPHPGIGFARRMQVPEPSLQHAVMIEAVENHMPEVIVIDEIGTELEAQAARTIAERGVQLVGTAHGNTLENLMMNPTLSDLIGGIQSVTLGDEEARRRGTQKSILERKAPPTFDVLVEIQSWDRVAVHANVAETVDSLLRGYDAPAEIRELTDDGEVRRYLAQTRPTVGPGGWLDTGDRRGRGRDREYGRERPFERTPRELPPGAVPPVRPAERRVYPFGIARNRLEQAIRGSGVPATIAADLDEADVVLTLRNYYRRKPGMLREAESRQIPIYVLKNNTVAQMEQSLLSMREPARAHDPVLAAMRETEEAISQVMAGERSVDLSPANAFIRRIQHQIAQRHNVESRSHGREPYRRVRITPGPAQDFDFERS
ncbi:MAG: AAA family ATPase [Armatimonadetes bacterium]|nr:AAA family ATPase [Armatimonadota bacterium]